MSVSGNGHSLGPRPIPQRKFQVGDKVKIKSKSVGWDWDFFLSHASDWGYERIGNNFVGYIVRIWGNPYAKKDRSNCFMVSRTPYTKKDVSYFTPQDLELLEPVEEKEIIEEEQAADMKSPSQAKLTVPEEKARLILAWYLDNHLLEPKEGDGAKLSKQEDAYPLVNRYATEPQDREGYETILIYGKSAPNTRIAMRELAMCLYAIVTGHSQLTDPFFAIEGYPPVKQYNAEISEFLAAVINGMIRGIYRDGTVLKEALDSEKRNS